MIDHRQGLFLDLGSVFLVRLEAAQGRNHNARVLIPDRRQGDAANVAVGLHHPQNRLQVDHGVGDAAIGGMIEQGVIDALWQIVAADSPPKPGIKDGRGFAFLEIAEVGLGWLGSAPGRQGLARDAEAGLPPFLAKLGLLILP